MKVISAFRVLILLALSTFAAPRNLHVATNGNDSWSGTIATPNRNQTDGPLGSLESALKKSRALRKSDDGISILLHNGTFALREPLKLGAKDSGTSKAPFMIAAFEGDNPIISGGRQITGWRNVRSNLWQAEVAEARNGQWYFRQLFIDGHRATRARTPNEGKFFKMRGARFIDKPVHFQFAAGDIRPSWSDEPD